MSRWRIYMLMTSICLESYHTRSHGQTDYLETPSCCYPESLGGSIKLMTIHRDVNNRSDCIIYSPLWQMYWSSHWHALVTAADLFPTTLKTLLRCVLEHPLRCGIPYNIFHDFKQLWWNLFFYNIKIMRLCVKLRKIYFNNFKEPWRGLSFEKRNLSFKLNLEVWRRYIVYF